MREFNPRARAITPPLEASCAPSPALSVEAVIEQAWQARQRNAGNVAGRLARGERLSAERLYDMLHTQKLAGWWLLVDRHSRHSRIGRGLTPAQAVAKYVSWISPYLDDDAPSEPDVALGVLGLSSVHELALAHLDRALALIRQDAASTFLAQAKSLEPASIEQAPSTSAGQEATA